MSGDPADGTQESPQPKMQTEPLRRRRGLRVPISIVAARAPLSSRPVQRTSSQPASAGPAGALSSQAAPAGSSAPASRHASYPEGEPQSGVIAAPGGVFDAGDFEDATLPNGEELASDPAISVETTPPIGTFSIPITEGQPVVEDEVDPMASIEIDTGELEPGEPDTRELVAVEPDSNESVPGGIDAGQLEVGEDEPQGSETLSDEEAVTLSSHPAPVEEYQTFEHLKTDPSLDLEDIRFSEPPEEIFLEDAEFVGRQELTKPVTEAPGELDGQSAKPPPPPVAPSSQPAQEEKPDLGPWHEHFFGEDYLRTVRTPTPKEVAVECDFIEHAIRAPAGARILDVGCGLGLQTVEMACRGYRMHGVDISPTMVSRARDEAEDRGVSASFEHDDMRVMSFDEPFEALMCWGTSFGYFDEETNEQVIQRFHSALAPHGILLLEVVNRDFIISSQPNQVWFEVDGSVCMEETDFDYETSCLRVKRRVASHDGHERDREYRIRLYALHEIRELLERNGFRVDEVSGREATPNVFFGAHSPKMILRAERQPGPFSADDEA